MPTSFVIVRHGQTDWNLARRIQGSTDIPLNALGVLQAEHTREALRDASFDVVASSHLQRAAFTASTINEPHGRDHVIDARLSERAFASVEGWTVEAVNEAFGSFDAVNDIERWDAVITRMRDALEDLADAHDGGRVLVVAHGSAIRALIGSIQGIGPRDVPSMMNCSITEVSRDAAHHWSMVSFNDNTHLPEALRT